MNFNENLEPHQVKAVARLVMLQKYFFDSRNHNNRIPESQLQIIDEWVNGANLQYLARYYSRQDLERLSIAVLHQAIDLEIVD